MRQITFRAPPKLREKMDRAADREHRSRSNWLRKVIRERVEQKRELNEEDNAP